MKRHAADRSSDPVLQLAFVLHRADPGRRILTLHACKQDLTIEAAAGASGEVIITDPEGADPEVLFLPGVGPGCLSACAHATEILSGCAETVASVCGPDRVVRVWGRPVRGPGD